MHAQILSVMHLDKLIISKNLQIFLEHLDTFKFDEKFLRGISLGVESRKYAYVFCFPEALVLWYGFLLQGCISEFLGNIRDARGML